MIKARVTAALGVGALIITALFAGGNAQADVTPTATGNFYIVGTQIIDPTGHVYFPIGANVGSCPNNFDWAGCAAGHSDEALAWGWNTVRLTIYCTSTQTWSRVNATDGDKVLLADIDKVVSEYTAKKIVVMVECHDANDNPAEAATFWTDMANTYKTNPYVWFNYMNEPEWGDNAKWQAEQKEWLARVRATGAENIFVADVMNAGQDVGWASALKIYDPTMGPALAAGQCNVLFSLHNYGGQSNSSDGIMHPEWYVKYYQAVHAAGLPLITGEYGMDYRLDFVTLSDGSVKVISRDRSNPKKITGDGFLHSPNGVWATDNYAEANGVGYLLWHATFADKLIVAGPPDGVTGYGKPNFYNILNPTRDGLVPGFYFSRMGEDSWNAGHKTRTPAVFTGNYADSHCASTAPVVAPTP